MQRALKMRKMLLVGIVGRARTATGGGGGGGGGVEDVDVALAQAELALLDADLYGSCGARVRSRAGAGVR